MRRNKALRRALRFCMVFSKTENTTFSHARARGAVCFAVKGRAMHLEQLVSLVGAWTLDNVLPEIKGPAARFAAGFFIGSPKFAASVEAAARAAGAVGGSGDVDVDILGAALDRGFAASGGSLTFEPAKAAGPTVSMLLGSVPAFTFHPCDAASLIGYLKKAAG